MLFDVEDGVRIEKMGQVTGLSCGRYTDLEWVCCFVISGFFGDCVFYRGWDGWGGIVVGFWFLVDSALL